MEKVIKSGDKEWWANLVTLVIFSLCFGFFGLDRFYQRQIWVGILKLISFGGFLIWYFIDICRYTYRFRKTGWWAE
jgi:TM2 domain-containing membrane protein YozV